MGSLWRDLRYALRSLKKDRRFAFVAIFALALGIGATTAIFSVIYGLLIAPFPYKDFNRSAIFIVHDLKQGGDNNRYTFPIPQFVAYRERNHVFEDMVGSYNWDVRYNDGKGTRQFTGAWVTTNAFDYYGVPPLLGRGFTPEDGKPGAPPVFVMNYRLWQSEFNGDGKILGKTFVLNNKPRTLVGIMPLLFDGYFGANVYLPLGLYPDADEASFFGRPATLLPMGRLKRGVSLGAAAADLNVVAHSIAKAYSERYPEQVTVTAETFVDSVVGEFKNTLYALLAAVFLLLLIACSNVANLVLARATAREREIAIRASLGASRGRLVTQLLVESFVLAAGASVAGCGFAYFGLKGVVATIPPGTVPGETVIGLNPAVLLFALGVTVLTTFICGLAPAMHAVSGDLNARLAGSGKGSGGGFGRGKFRAALVITEVALSIVLLAGAGLMLRTFFALTHVELGFNPAGMLYIQLATPEGRYDSGAQKKLLIRPILERVKALPGVIGATESIQMPPRGGFPGGVTVPGRSHSEPWDADCEMVSEGFFQTLGLHLLRGRLLSEDEVDSARRLAVVNRTLARQFFGNEDAVGQRIKFDGFDHLPDAPPDVYFEIVGVVTDYRNAGLRSAPAPQAFIPYTFTGVVMDRTIMVRAAAAPKSLLKSIARAVWAVDPDVGFRESGAIEDYAAGENKNPKFELITLGAFAGIGLLLVVIGIFGVMAYTVTLQTREIGIRMALGAQQSDILRMVLKKGLGLIAAGAIIGLFASFSLTRFIASQIWGVSPTDPWTFVTVVAVIAVVGLAACLLPARRATQVDPLVALHYE